MAPAGTAQPRTPILQPPLSSLDHQNRRPAPLAMLVIELNRPLTPLPCCLAIRPAAGRPARESAF
eukprot:11534396-Alexandrium_andersonii.AAC.1